MPWSILTGALLGLAIVVWMEWRYRRMLETRLKFLTSSYVDGHVCYVWQNGQWWRVRAWRLPMLGPEGEAVGDWPRVESGDGP